MRSNIPLCRTLLKIQPCMGLGGLIIPFALRLKCAEWIFDSCAALAAGCISPIHGVARCPRCGHPYVCKDSMWRGMPLFKILTGLDVVCHKCGYVAKGRNRTVEGEKE